MPRGFRPKKGDMVHYVCSSGAHRPAMIVRRRSPDEEIIQVVGLVVFLDGRHDSQQAMTTGHADQIRYGEPQAGMATHPVNTWHWAEDCSGHEFD